MSIVYELGTDSSDAVTLYPEYDYKISDRKIETVHRSQDDISTMTKYKWGNFKKIQFGLEYLPDSDAQLINEWWLDNTELLFFVTDATTEVYSVYLMGDESPLKSFNVPYTNLFKGSILLETY